jgi:hypothetical protein
MSFSPVRDGSFCFNAAMQNALLKDDLENAGAHWVDEPAVVDGNLVSSRTPVDLPHFARARVQFLENDPKTKLPARPAAPSSRQSEATSMALKKAMFRDVLK